MKRLASRLLLPLLLTSGCAVLSPVPVVPPLVGSVETHPERQIAASLTEVANGATVSLIDPTTGNTLVTTLTTADGRFNLGFTGSGFVPATGPYFLEAAKGLAGGGSPNRAGASLVRVRTLVSFTDEGWKTLTSEGIRIGRSTTALCILSNLKGLTGPQNLDLLARLQMGTPSSPDGIAVPDTFVENGALSAAEFARAYELVDRALVQDLDPVAAVFKRPDGAASSQTGPGMSLRPGLGLSLDGWNVTAAVPATGPGNTLVTLYGQALPASVGEVGVSLNGQACTVAEVAADGSYLRFRVPAGVPAGGYPIRVTIGPWTHSAIAFTVTP